MSHSLEVANTIISQIKAMDFWALGYIGTKQHLAIEENGKPGLRLICTKGVMVDILLDECEDLYEVTSWKAGRGANRHERKIKFEAIEVFVDSMPQTMCDAYDNAIGAQ